MYMCTVRMFRELVQILNSSSNLSNILLSSSLPVSELSFNSIFYSFSLKHRSQMEEMQTKVPGNSPQKFQKLFYRAQIGLRFATFGTSFAAALLTVTNVSTIELIPGFRVVAKYSYEDSFTYLAAVNFIAATFSLLSVFGVIILDRCGSNSANYFFLFICDLLILSLEISASGAATAVGLLAKNGNEHTGWPAICSFAAKFCMKGAIAVAFAYFSFINLLILAVISASKSRQVHV
ncbi:hypothetical protein K2173_027618 [Erythroxylum novogranatense]|uniref:CASP-like protein n=1 Tax=Erythroxylum novogranatense TaxID=1862640 RepID=A0AAV8U0W3_9ROSI|nr:hypothetical protein K2173_027618 [Erythroxylum novogranatense]